MLKDDPQFIRSIKPSVRSLNAYRVTQDFSRVKLNQNESPFDVPVELKKEISRKLLDYQWNRYPDNFADALTAKLSLYTGFPAPGIIPGNSSNELLQTAIYSACSSGDAIVVANPGFPVYKRIASVMDIDVREVSLRRDFSVDPGHITAASGGARMVILASPNNPTGLMVPLEDIDAIASAIEGILVVDEAYFEFCRQSAQQLLDKHWNIIIVRTFSKAFNLAAMRLGYMIGRPELMDELGKAKLPFSVGLFQQAAGETVLENHAFVRTNVDRIISERERIVKELKAIPLLQTFPTEANFILVRSWKIPAREIYLSLYEKGVAVRYFDTPELKDCLRITVGTPGENTLLLEKLKQIVDANNNPAVQMNTTGIKYNHHSSGLYDS